ncbi:MAG TPA: hypothetical protein VM537_06535 [Anaerolineae bacterium]|nr:hypothetical protein [Anaerolineae bacterium]
MSRTLKQPRLICAWCHRKIRRGTAVKHRGKAYCDIGCGGDHPSGRKYNSATANRLRALAEEVRGGV